MGWIFGVGGGGGGSPPPLSPTLSEILKSSFSLQWPLAFGAGRRWRGQEKTTINREESHHIRSTNTHAVSPMATPAAHFPNEKSALNYTQKTKKNISPKNHHLKPF